MSINLKNFDTKSGTDMAYMFSNCPNITSLDLSDFNTGNVENMEHMFSSLKVLTSLKLIPETLKP